METKNNFTPILFNTEMVQANLENRKKQTRRIAPFDKRCTKVFQSENGKWQQNYNNNQDPEKMFQGGWNEWTNYSSPYEIGNILWVRETTKVGAWREEECQIAFDYKASPELKETPWCFFEEEKFEKLHLETIEALDKKGFEAHIDEETEYCTYYWEPGHSPLNWKPSLFMPKEAARIFLKVTNVRCERLQDISEEDAIAEGISFQFYDTDFKEEMPRYKNYLNKLFQTSSPIYSFASLWRKINGKDSWKKNPWVWVYDFERIEKPENFK